MTAAMSSAYGSPTVELRATGEVRRSARMALCPASGNAAASPLADEAGVTRRRNDHRNRGRTTDPCTHPATHEGP